MLSVPLIPPLQESKSIEEGDEANGAPKEEAATRACATAGSRDFGGKKPGGSVSSSEDWRAAAKKGWEPADRRPVLGSAPAKWG